MRRLPLLVCLLVAAHADASAQVTAIKAGLAADIIATPRNPLDDILALKSVSFVMKNGKVFEDAR
jgi:imidazolonepropionase-like amidohydrolase